MMKNRPRPSSLFINLSLTACVTAISTLAAPERAFAQGGQAPAATSATTPGPAPAATPSPTPAPASTNSATATPAASANPAGGTAPANKPPELPPAVLEEAQRLYQFGQEAYNKKRYDVAFGSFNRVYQLTKSPDLLYNLAKVAIKLDQKEVAIGYYRQYLSSHPPDEATVQKEMDELTGGPPPPPPQALTAPAGEATIPRWVPWALIGGGTGLLGISLGLLVAGGISPADTAADQAQRRGMLASGGVLGGIGLAATVGGVVLKLREKSANKPAASASLHLLPMGTGLQLAGTF